jgi:two-component system CheB/CheR fusion protein
MQEKDPISLIEKEPGLQNEVSTPSPDHHAFFRRPAIYRSLIKKVIPALLKKRSPGDPLRVWIPSCHTGEEAWSIAICLMEYWKEHELGATIRIFATDASEPAVTAARKGIYDKATLADLPDKMLNEYFERTADGYRVGQAARELCVFATHDLQKDPPFSFIDIICCEKLPAHPGTDARRRAMEAFHYALKPTGYFLPGETEMIAGMDPLFMLPNNEWKIYVKTGASVSWLPEAPFPGQPDNLRPSRASVEKEADNILLSHYVPACILVNKELRIIRFYGAAFPYLRPSSGKATLNLVKLLRDELVFELHYLTQHVKSTGQAIKKEGIILSDKGMPRDITMEAVPLKSPAGEGLMLLIFRENTNPFGAGQAITTAPKQKGEGLVDTLRRDLREARQQLLSMSDAFEQTKEELQSIHEEVLSSNEELQSVNDQLALSHEELQTANEALFISNNELHLRNGELAESANYAGAIIESIREPLVALNGDLCIASANKAFYTYFHLQPELVEGRPFDEISNGQFNKEELSASLRQLVAKKTPFADLELKCSLPWLGERILLLRVTRIFVRTGKGARLLLTMEDITERKIAERKKDEFIGIASHELKTPATSIQAYTQILYNEFIDAKDERSANMVSKLNSRVTRLTRLTKDLLDVTKITEGQLRLKQTNFDLDTLVGEIVEEMQRTTHHRIVIDKKEQSHEVWADKERMEQVLANLLANAIKYSPEAEDIIVSVRMGKKDIRLSVQDFGIGIAPEMRDKVFERFFRSADPSTTNHPGLGLGLYISHEIVRQHGGKIRVSSEKDKGSVFTVTLPLKAGAADDQ